MKTPIRSIRISDRVWRGVQEAARIESEKRGIDPNATDWIIGTILTHLDNMEDPARERVMAAMRGDVTLVEELARKMAG